MCAMKLGELEVEIGADTTGLKKAGKEVKKTSKSMEQSFSKVGTAIKAALSIEVARRVLMIADNMVLVEAKVRRLTKSTDEFDDSMKSLLKTSNETGVALSNSVAVFQRFTQAKEIVGATNDQVLAFADTIQKLGLISGATGDEIFNTSVQIGQALTNNFASAAQEINSINEQMPEVARAVERSLGLAVGSFKTAFSEGKRSSQDFFEAILKSSESTNIELAKMPVTILKASNALSNNFSVAISELDKQLGTSQNIASFISFLAGATAEIAADIKLKPLKDAQFELFKVNAEIKKINESTASLSSLQKALKESTSGQASAAISAAINEHSDRQGELKALDDRRTSLLKNIEKLKADSEVKPKGKVSSKLAPKVGPVVVDLDDEIKRLDLLADVYDDKFAEIEADILRTRQKAIKLYGEDSKEFLAIDERLNQKRVELNNDMFSDMDKRHKEALDSQAEAAKDIADETARAFDAMNNRIGDELAEAITGAQSFSDAFKNIMSDLISQLISAGITSAFGGAVGGGNVFAGLFSSAVGATAGGNAFGGGVSPIASHRVNERGDPEMLTQAGKQFLLPNGKGGKVTPLPGGKGGGAQPNISMINMGTPMNVESVNITEDGVEVMINDKLAAFDKALTAEMSKPNSSKSRAFKNTFRLEQNMRR